MRANGGGCSSKRVAALPRLAALCAAEHGLARPRKLKDASERGDEFGTRHRRVELYSEGETHTGRDARGARSTGGGRREEMIDTPYPSTHAYASRVVYS